MNESFDCPKCGAKNSEISKGLTPDFNPIFAFICWFCNEKTIIGLEIAEEE